jgi:hypothetical protein
MFLFKSDLFVIINEYDIFVVYLGGNRNRKLKIIEKRWGIGLN